MVRQAFIEEFSSSSTTKGRRDGSDQDNTVTSSSSSSATTLMHHGDGGCSDDELLVVASSSSSSSTSTSTLICEEETLHAMIDVLENERPMQMDSEGRTVRASQKVQSTSEQDVLSRSRGHSVEYWTVGADNKRKNFIKKFPLENQIGNGSPGSASMPTPTHNEMLSSVKAAPLFQQQPINCYNNGAQIFHPNLPAEPFPVYQYNHQNFTQSPYVAVQQSPMQIFIPPGHQAVQSTGQFVPAAQQQQFIQPHVVPQAAYYHPHQYYGVPVPTMAMSTVSYYQGMPLFYQTAMPPTSAPYQPLYNNSSLPEYSLGGGYARHAEFLRAINTTDESAQSSPRGSEDEVNIEVSTGQSQAQANQCFEPDSTKSDSDSTVVDSMNTSTSSIDSNHFLNGSGMALDNSWHLPNFLVPSSPSSSVGSSLSDTDLSGILVGTQARNGVDDNGSITSGYSSAPSTPNSRTLAPGFTAEAEINGGMMNHNLAPLTESLDNQNEYVGGDGMASTQSFCSTVEAGMYDYEQYALQLRAQNDARMGNIFLQDIVAVPTAHSHDYIYPGERVMLLYSEAEGCGNVMMFNNEMVPYVANTFDLNVQSSLSLQSSGSKCFRYFVPPRTSDNDYFGGQMTMWQIKMVHYFLKYHPHIWKMHGVPETFDIGMFLGNTMKVLGEFHIVSKLRFCCRACKTPWTSKKGTIVFKFCFNSTTNRGWILMRIFGQICIKQECTDWTFQNPACYPEEIDRAMKKLSEYIGLHVYGIAVKPNCFADCFKSIRKSGGGGGTVSSKTATGYPTPHKSEFCQACMNGVCKNLFIPALANTASKTSSSSQISQKQIQLEETPKC